MGSAKWDSRALSFYDTKKKPGKPHTIKQHLHRRKGERGIRTLDNSLLRTMPVFKTGAINHSAISPRDNFYYIFIPPNRTWPYQLIPSLSIDRFPLDIYLL